MAGDAVASAMEHGHSRARTRWWGQRPPAESDGSAKAAAERPSASLEETVPAIEAPTAAISAPDVSVAVEVEAEQADRRPFFIPGALFRKREVGFRDGHVGYLADGPPVGLRFAESESVGSRPASPALPEFLFATGGYEPYLLESPLDSNPMNNPELLSQIVIDLEPHQVLSGVIDTRRQTLEPKVEHFELEESRPTILRPEEVLIYFETDNGGDRTRTIIPFAPATPLQESPKSSARFRKE